MFLLAYPSGLAGTAHAAIAGLSAYLGHIAATARAHRKARLLEESHRSLSHQGIKPLSRALAELAIGNTSTRIDRLDIAALDTARFERLRRSPRSSMFRTVVAQCIDDFDAITFEPCDRVRYVGTDNYLEGERCGEILGEALAGRGEVAILLNSLEKVNHRLRRNGFMNSMALKYPGIEIVAVLETSQVPENTYRKTLELLDTRPRLAGIYVDEASTPHAAMKALEERARIDSVKVVAHDVTEASLPYIREGRLRTLSQNPYSQGYDSIVLGYNYFITHEKPIIDRILPTSEESELIDERSLGRFWDDRRGRVLSEKARCSLSTPCENRGGGALRIGVILPNDTGFFKLVGEGMRDAAAILRPRGVTVDIIVPEELKRGDDSAATVRRYIEKLEEDGAVVVVTPVSDEALVGYINELSKKGVTVVTYNSEPIGLRSMLDSVFKNSDFIREASETLAANSVESMEATRQINLTMEKIVKRVELQMGGLSEAEEVIRCLLTDVERVTEKSGESSAIADEATGYAANGQSMVARTGESLRAIRANYRKTSALLLALNDNSRKVQEIVALMEDLASKTSIIAINVSILAARAGKNGSGFAVVAGEIRDLASHSASSAVDIAALISSTLKNITRSPTSSARTRPISTRSPISPDRRRTPSTTSSAYPLTIRRRSTASSRSSTK